MENEMKIMDAATLMYTRLFHNLIESISNCAKTCEGAMMFCDDGKSIHYQMGKVDAYRELANRILKEKNITFNQFRVDWRLARSLKMILRGYQIESLEKIIPDDHYRGNYEEFRKKCEISACFSREMVKAFELGINFAKMSSEPEFKEYTEDELYQRLLECSKLSPEAIDFVKKTRETM